MSCGFGLLGFANQTLALDAGLAVASIVAETFGLPRCSSEYFCRKRRRMNMALLHSLRGRRERNRRSHHR
jgi:hypothetical protein